MAVSLTSKQTARIRQRMTSGESFHGTALGVLRNRLRDAKICVYCWRTSEKRLQWDHVDALARGGDHSDANTAGVCARCNASKGSRFLLEWVLAGRAPIEPTNVQLPADVLDALCDVFEVDPGQLFVREPKKRGKK